MHVKGCEECETRMNCSIHDPIMRNPLEARQLANVAYNFGYDEGQALGLYKATQRKDSPNAVKRATCPNALQAYAAEFAKGFSAGWMSAFEDWDGM